MYIRTKDGVYELVDNLYQYHNGVEKFWYAKEENGTTLAIEITANKILNQSENLEELCDEFVLYDNQLKTYGVFDKKVITFKWIQNHSTIYKGMTIYGAIWTDKGLQFVARMNSKGELELL